MVSSLWVARFVTFGKRKQVAESYLDELDEMFVATREAVENCLLKMRMARRVSADSLSVPVIFVLSGEE
jgi:hypothetical protein